jgi:hypothetical protein
MLMTISVKASKHLIEVAFLVGAIGATLLALAALAKLRNLVNWPWLSLLGSSMVAIAFVLAIVAFHWGRF